MTQKKISIDITESFDEEITCEEIMEESTDLIEKVPANLNYYFKKVKEESEIPLETVNKTISERKKDSKSFAEKYRPKTLNEIMGQAEAIVKIKIFVANYPKKKKAMVLYGGPGTGKTTMAHAIAKAMDAEIFELNASDLRNKNKLQEVLKPAIEQKSLTKLNKIILVDEVDGICAVDRGGLSELLELISITTYPVIITANDIWKNNLSSLRQKAELVEVREINYNIIKDVLINILKKEKLSINDDVLTKIAVKANGDLRAALNDLQTASRLKDPSKFVPDERNRRTDIFNALKLVFKGKPNNDLLKVYDSVDMQIDEIFLWLEENINKEYSGLDLVRAYDLLSKADVFKGRIHKQQYWRFLVYENALLSYGISSAKKNSNCGFTSYQKPTRILKIWLSNQRNAKKKSIAQKYAKLVHVGYKRAMNEFPIIKQIIQSNPKIQQELKLEKDEIEYIVR